MKKTLTLLALLLISMGAMAQDALQEALAKVDGYWTVEGDKVVVSATINTSVDGISDRIARLYPYSHIEYSEGIITVKHLQFKAASSDEFIDYNARSYKANYDIQATYDTLVHINIIIDELYSRTDDNDCRMINLFPINTECRIIDGVAATLRNDERIKFNEGIIFSKIINKAIDEIERIGKFVSGEVVFTKESEDGESLVIADISETQKITMHINKFRKTAVIGEAMMIGGGALAVSSIFLDNPQGAKATMICGGIIGIAGYITRLSAYQHLKPNKVSFSANGVVYSF